MVKGWKETIKREYKKGVAKLPMELFRECVNKNEYECGEILEDGRITKDGRVKEFLVIKIYTTDLESE